MTNTMNCWLDKIIPIYFHRKIPSITGYLREESHNSLIPKLAIKSCVHNLSSREPGHNNSMESTWNQLLSRYDNP